MDMDSFQKSEINEILPPRLAIVVPCYNEEEVILDTNKTLLSLLNEMIEQGLVAEGSYLLYVDDGSSDRTWEHIVRCTENTDVRGIKLTGNRGHQNAIMAGLEFVSDKCDAAVTIDADLQDDIRAIPAMVEKYRAGADIVFGVRKDRKSDTWFKRTSAIGFYRLSRRLGMNTIYNHADFRLLSSACIGDLLQYEERNLFMRGIVSTLGRKSDVVEYSRLPRMAGTTKYPLRKMINFAIDGITSFSIKPVRLVFGIGLCFMVVALVMLVYVLVRYFQGETLRGWASTILSIWFCSGVVLLSLGVIGEYIGKIYTEVKHRPRYIVERSIYREKEEKNKENDKHNYPDSADTRPGATAQ